jgi:hypothetical protein
MLQKVLKGSRCFTTYTHVPFTPSGVKGEPLTAQELRDLGKQNLEQSKPLDYAAILPSDSGIVGINGSF